jgi:hypothetical protein
MSSVRCNRICGFFCMFLWNIHVVLLHLAKPFQWDSVFPLVFCSLNAIILIAVMMVKRNDDSLGTKLEDFRYVFLSFVLCSLTILGSFRTLTSYEYQAYDLHNYTLYLTSTLVLSVLLHTMNIVKVLGDEIIALKRKSQEL